jgi:TRAP-type mannitol/chloroaromatic compound transport system permease large subunit
MGMILETIRHGRRPARHRWTVLRADARRSWPIAVILVGALLAATTGVVAASVIAMGLISLPDDAAIWLRPQDFDSGVIAASGTLGADHPALPGADRPG